MNSMLNKTLLAVALVAIVGGTVDAACRGGACPRPVVRRQGARPAVVATHKRIVIKPTLPAKPAKKQQATSRFARFTSSVTTQGSKVVAKAKKAGSSVVSFVKDNYGKLAAGVAATGGVAYAAYRNPEHARALPLFVGACLQDGISFVTTPVRRAASFVSAQAQKGASLYSNKVGFVNTGCVLAAALLAKKAYNYVTAPKAKTAVAKKPVVARTLAKRS